MYFEKLPYTFYTLDNGKTVQIIQNILLRVIVNEEVKNNYSIYDEYDIKDGDTPEILADLIYGTSQLHWLILHYNEILDPRFGWPLSTNNLREYCLAKYDNINATHHYENSEGYVVNSTYPGALPVTNFMYEDRLNETKRRIRILKPQYAEALIKEVTSKLEAVNG